QATFIPIEECRSVPIESDPSNYVTVSPDGRWQREGALREIQKRVLRPATHAELERFEGKDLDQAVVAIGSMACKRGRRSKSHVAVLNLDRPERSLGLIHWPPGQPKGSATIAPDCLLLGIRVDRSQTASE